MMFIELFTTRGALTPERRRQVAERLGSVRELTEGEEMHAGWVEVFRSLFQVVVHEPEVWVVGERALGPDDPPRFVVRVHVPGPWRKDVSKHLISYLTRVLAEAGTDPERPYREPVVQVHVLGVTEGSIGLLGRPTTSEGIVELMNEPYEEDFAAGRAVKDPLCGVIVPLDEHAVTLERDGKVLGFCCADCRELFTEKERKAAARA